MCANFREAASGGFDPNQWIKALTEGTLVERRLGQANREPFAPGLGLHACLEFQFFDLCVVGVSTVSRLESLAEV